MVARSLLFAAAVSSFSSVAFAANPTVGSPALYQCTPAAYVYTCDNAPCSIVIRPSDDQTKSIATIGTDLTGDGSASWTVSEAEGSSVTAWITDSTGLTGNNAATTIAAGSDSCSASSGSAAAATSAGSSAASSAAGSASSAASGARTSAASAASSAAASGASKASSVAGSASSAAASASASADAGSGASSLVAGGFVASALALAAVLA